MSTAVRVPTSVLCAHMSCEITLMSTSEVTLGALVRLFTSVNSHMPFQVIGFEAQIITTGTAEFFNSSWHHLKNLNTFPAVPRSLTAGTDFWEICR